MEKNEIKSDPWGKDYPQQEISFMYLDEDRCLHWEGFHRKLIFNSRWKLWFGWLDADLDDPNYMLDE